MIRHPGPARSVRRREFIGISAGGAVHSGVVLRESTCHRGGRLLLFAYALAVVHVAFVFTVGEPYPSLQGPMFAGHLQQDRIIHVPFHRNHGNEANLPSHENLLRHETLAIPAQQDISRLAPSHPGRAAREFLIGHSLRSPGLRPRASHDFAGVKWSAYKFRVPLHTPPELIGEEDIIND